MKEIIQNHLPATIIILMIVMVVFTKIVLILIRHLCDDPFVKKYKEPNIDSATFIKNNIERKNKDA